MILNGSSESVPDSLETHNLSNGGCAVLDSNNRLIAYNKRGEPDGNNWDWVRKDCRIGS
jgi:hypothetical protein